MPEVFCEICDDFFFLFNILGHLPADLIDSLVVSSKHQENSNSMLSFSKKTWCFVQSEMTGQNPKLYDMDDMVAYLD